MQKICVLILTAILAVPCFAQTNTPAAVKNANLRPKTTVHLILDKENDFEVELPEGPYIAKDEVNLISGEELFFSAEVKNNRLINLKRSDTRTGDNVIILRFWQNDNREKPGMVLSIKNPFKSALSYKARIHPAEKTKLFPVSVADVEAGAVGMELWPGPIVRIVLSDFSVAATVQETPAVKMKEKPADTNAAANGKQ